MTEPKDPARLTEAPGGLGGALRSAQADVASAAQLERLSARLGSLLGPPPAGPPDVRPPTTGSGLGAVKLALSGIALIVAGGAAWQAATYQPVSPPEPKPVPATALPRAAPASPPAVSAGAPLGVRDAGAAPAEAPSVATAAPAAPQKASARPTALSEAELLEQARSAMKSDPARALSRANEHRQHFPRGALVQEREVIAIKALRALGRSGEADARAEAFAKAFPGSAFERKLKPSP